MIKIQFALILLVIVVPLISYNSNLGVNAAISLLDDRDAESIAQIVCTEIDSKFYQIARISTISKLRQFFDQPLAEGHKLRKCQAENGIAIGLLERLLGVSNENVCSDEKVTLIEEYHNQYVATANELANKRKEENRVVGLPILNTFFMHYAMEVDALCQTTLINNLEWDVKRLFGDDIHQRLLEISVVTNSSLKQGSDATSAAVSDKRNEHGEVKQIFNGLMTHFMDLFSVNEYDDVLLVWDLIQISALSEREEFKEIREIRDDFDPVTGEPIKMMVKLKAARGLKMIQKKCHLKIKPIYSKLILPIIRLANLGYANNGERFKIELDELRSSDLVRRWYAATQLCEALLPIKAYEDRTMELRDMIVLTKREAEELDKQASERHEEEEDYKGEIDNEKLEYEPTTNTMVGVDQLDSMSSAEAQKLVQAVNLNMNARDRTVRRVLVHLVKKLKENVKHTKLGRFFLSKPPTKAGEQPARAEIGANILSSLEQMDEDQIMNMNGAAKRHRIKTGPASGEVVKRVRQRRRQGDLDMRFQQQTEAINIQRTMTWAEIFAPLTAVFEAIMPTRFQLLVGGAVIIGVFFLLTIICLMGVLHGR